MNRSADEAWNARPGWTLREAATSSGEGFTPPRSSPAARYEPTGRSRRIVTDTRESR